jgi:hypothetical protein
MKFSKMNLQRTFIRTIIILLAIGIATPGFAAKVKILGGSSLVDGEPFTQRR